MGRWSRTLARLLVEWLDVPPGRHWLEVGCGTGALTEQVCELADPASVVAVDPSPHFVGHARAHLPDPRVEFLVAGADALPRRPGGFDVVVSSLVLNFIPDPVAGVTSMREVTADDGLVGASVWDYAGGMELLRRFWDAAIDLDPTARSFDEGQRFPICSPPALEAVFRDAGFGHVSVSPLETPTHFIDFDDYWRPFVGGPGPAPTYLSSLPAAKQGVLAERVRSSLPQERDGSIRLTARAWTIQARK